VESGTEAESDKRRCLLFSRQPFGARRAGCRGDSLSGESQRAETGLVGRLLLFGSGEAAFGREDRGGCVAAKSRGAKPGRRKRAVSVGTSATSYGANGRGK